MKLLYQIQFCSYFQRLSKIAFGCSNKFLVKNCRNLNYQKIKHIFFGFFEFFLKFSRIFSRFFVQKIVIQNANKLLWYFSGLLRHSVYTVRYGVSDTINTRIPPNKKPNFQNCHWHEKHWIKNIERKFVVHGLKKVMMKKIIEKQIEYFFFFALWSYWSKFRCSSRGNKLRILIGWNLPSVSPDSSSPSDMSSSSEQMLRTLTSISVTVSKK